MFEEFDPKHKDFFCEKDYHKRWEQLKDLFKVDFDSYRVLFFVETLGLIDSWDEPDPIVLQKLLKFVTTPGKHVAFKTDDILKLLYPV